MLTRNYQAPKDLADFDAWHFAILGAWLMRSYRGPAPNGEQKEYRTAQR